MTEILALIRESGGFSTLLLASSGTLFVLYVLTIVVLANWPKAPRR